MITITGFLHRDELNDVIRRWMYGQVLGSDAARIPCLVHFNTAYVRRYLQRFACDLFRRLHGQPPRLRATALKGELKDAIVMRPPRHTERIAALLRQYRAHPGVFYRETPFNGTMFFTGEAARAQYIGSTRIKRVRRLAEKSARRIIDWLFDTIKAEAEHLADERARQLSIPREWLVTEPDNMVQEFVQAENRLLEDLRHGRPIQPPHPLVINDVAGVKVLLEAERQHLLGAVLEQMDDCRVIEREEHSGHYNAVNYIVRYAPPRDEILAVPLGPETLSAMQRRGVDPARAGREFREFVLGGEQSVNIEIILSDYEEMLESEIGRCMHEERIIRQRLTQQYHGHLARNTEYLLVYLFAFAASARRELVSLPITVWNRYLPDYFQEILFDLLRQQPCCTLSGDTPQES
jgi:hypothetical protein